MTPETPMDCTKHELDGVANALELMALTSAGKDPDLSKFCAMNAGYIRKFITHPTPPTQIDLGELIKDAQDSRYSNEFLGIRFRALFGKGGV